LIEIFLIKILMLKSIHLISGRVRITGVSRDMDILLSYIIMCIYDLMTFEDSVFGLTLVCYMIYKFVKSQ